MNRSLLLLIATAILSWSSFAMAAPTPMYPINTYDNITLLRNFALARCISHAYDDASVRKDARSVAAVYVYISQSDNLDTDYSNLDEFVADWLKKSDADQRNGKSKVIQYMDLYYSDEIREKIELYTANYTAKRIAANRQVRNEVLAQCVATAYDNKTIREDVENSTSGQLVFGEADKADHYSLSAY